MRRMLFMCCSELIPREIKSAMKHPEDLDGTVDGDEIRDAVMAIQENANIPCRGPVAVPHFRKFPE